MLIRPITSRDDAQVCTLVRSCLDRAGLAIPGTAYFDPQLPHLTAYYAGLEHAQYWVVEVEGRVVAGAGIAPVPGTGHICELQKLYVDASYQGRGYATALVDQALAYAQHWYQWCYLETHTKLDVARKMYANRGFKPLPRPLAAGEHQAMDHWAIKDLLGDRDYPPRF
ncbi:GNAT family N-acetyltransferase [Bifidobacterium sp.]|uniref:GNAT family N-acetyltransferase n=1 Tax=Bifidobacterium sp. TaxID=41200 RepID=UPI0025C33808|nr:GNAT family N-acetyltransferase [Bifidobacterium sp.]MCH4209390.1 GNAT family N-acetyltransferase [Bifidobacterium sp.]MCI1224969.1 GNAT family N-acetyltransferase [Bifidobacterium sp.]